MASAISSIYRTIVRASTPRAAPKRWHRFRGDRSFFVPPANPIALLETLKNRFDNHELGQAGVIKKNRQNGYTLNPLLSTAKTLVCSGSVKAPEDLILGGHALSGRRAFELFRDDRVPIDKECECLIVFSASDLSAFRTIGWRAVPAWGLESADDEALKELCTPPAPRNAPIVVPRAGLEIDDQRRPTGLTIVYWSPGAVSLRVSPHMTAVREHLLHFMAFQRSSLTISVWIPDDQHLKEIRSALALGKKRYVQKALASSYRNNRSRIGHEPPRLRTYSDHLSAYLADPEILAHDPYHEAIQTLRRLFDEEVLIPLQREVEGYASPIARGLGFQLVDAMRFHNRLTVTIMFDGRRKELNDSHLSPAMIPPAEFRQQSELLRRIVNLRKEISRLAPIR